MKKHFGELQLLLTAIIFGTSYVFITKASSYLSPFSVNGFRFLLGFLCVCPSLFIKDGTSLKDLFKPGFLIGSSIFLASYLQQSVSTVAQAGKMGFITSLYVILTPLFAFIFLKKHIKLVTALSILLAAIGLFVLCDVRELGIGIVEIKLIFVAAFFAIEILLVDHYTKKYHPIKLIAASFFFVALFDSILAITTESLEIGNLLKAAPSLLYLGILASGLSYFLQFNGQKVTDSTISSLIMSLESVVSVFAGFLFLNQKMTAKELIGCLIMFIAIIICELTSQNQNDY